MRCIACGRTLLKPAYTAPPELGGWHLGPKCLERADLLPRAMRQAVKAGKVKRKRAKVSCKKIQHETQLEMDLI